MVANKDIREPVCFRCTHYMIWPYCFAFPDGIPEDNRSGENDHSRPIDGDHGLQFELNDILVTEDIVERHLGGHVGQEGTPAGGSQPGFTHADGGVEDGKAARKERLRGLFSELKTADDKSLRYASLTKELIEAGTSHFLGRDVRLVQEIIDKASQTTGIHIYDGDSVLTVQYRGSSEISESGEPEMILSWIDASEKGTGLGTAFMRSAKAHADASGRPFRVIFVTNPKFYRKFSWLDRVNLDGSFASEFLYTPGVAGRVKRTEPDDPDEYDLTESPHDPRGKTWQPGYDPIERHLGGHVGQEGTPEGGSQPGFTHVEGSVEGGDGATPFTESGRRQIRKDYQHLSGFFKEKLNDVGDDFRDEAAFIRDEVQPFDIFDIGSRTTIRVLISPTGEIYRVDDHDPVANRLWKLAEDEGLVPLPDENSAQGTMQEITGNPVGAPKEALLMLGYTRGTVQKNILAFELVTPTSRATKRAIGNMLEMAEAKTTNPSFYLDVNTVLKGLGTDVDDANSFAGNRAVLAWVKRHGKHEGQEGTPEGGSQPGFTHVGTDGDSESGKRGHLRNATWPTLTGEGAIVLGNWENNVEIGEGIDEKGAIILEDGTIIEPEDTGEDYIDFTPTQMVNATRSEGPIVMTHTHPTDVPLSVTDVVGTMWDGIEEIRAVTPDAIYRMGFDVESDWDAKSAFGDWVRNVAPETFEQVRAIQDSIMQENAGGVAGIAEDLKRANATATRDAYGSMWEEAAKEFPEVIDYYAREDR